MTSTVQYVPLHPSSGSSLRPSRRLDADLARPARRPCTRFSLKNSAAAIVGTLFLVAIAAYVRSPSRSERELRLLEVGVEPDDSFADLWRLAQDGWRPYTPQEGREVRDGDLVSWAERVEAGCADEWVEEGRLCELGGSGHEQVDLVWTWTNGSDPLLRRWRAEVTGTLAGRVRPGVARVRDRKASHHFREHDELRYSLRSAVQAFEPRALGKLHLVSTDLPANTLLSDILDNVPVGNITPVVEAARVGQVPSWLNRSAIPREQLEVHHHSSFFEDTADLPTFNSLSIESQLPNILGLREFFLYLNDDTFLSGTMTSSDVGAPFLGPVFRIQRDLQVDALAPGLFGVGSDGEWASLRQANWLLDRRFGTRSRAYLAHIPKTFSTPVLRETSRIWHDELLETSTSRFRGRRAEYQLPFLVTHYTIEAHREALLHAFFAARSDRDLDGELSLDERRRLLVELGFELEQQHDAPQAVQVPLPRRRPSNDLLAQLERAGIRRAGATEVAFSSSDGHGMIRREEQVGRGRRSTLVRPVLAVNASAEEAAQPMCSIDLSTCFGADFLSSSTPRKTIEVLRRAAYEVPACGDCIVLALVGKSGSSGLSAFLPSCPPSSSPPSSSPPTPIALFSLAKRFVDVALVVDARTPSAPTCASARGLAVRRILRYSYTLGESSSQFVGMRQALPVPLLLRRPGWVTETSLPAFLTLNDDFATPEVSRHADEHLHRWFEQTWPTPSAFEKVALARTRT
ncbi:uncharacterized protein RHOBADRAFT_50790 [Rhodotorula graminis WP1]|uniref:Stealth protein CR3 conserved region 3 domain-containing protein n=1 Tax=Rhodotorula graminis (strain WP1) TaxID=578459 RepID=A0A194SCH7_RHOGW|nr:uncharacterized protein RHOBADRAFT_50790 [Rhodotorula graminis WP1]KPV78309.1 hypothetical protein RHOBADRAFT_50790 [Rhodotorula graminis WP1]